MKPEFSCGVVEGFYGRPWTFAQRHRVVGWLKRFGLNTYLHAPKDDLKHRVLWRELLDESEAGDFRQLIAACRESGIRFIHGIAPGWDDHFRAGAGTASVNALVGGLQQRFRQLLDLGCSDFAIMFDDVPDLPAAELAEIGRRHAEIANRIREWQRAAPVIANARRSKISPATEPGTPSPHPSPPPTGERVSGLSRRSEAKADGRERGSPPATTEGGNSPTSSSATSVEAWNDSTNLPTPILALCPAVYCTRMAGGAPGESPYLRALGAELDAGVDIFWTGPEIISPTITAEHLRDVTAVLRRPPFLWDNLHANDYDNARIFLGPFADRSPELPALSRGVVLNPNRDCELNFIPLATLGDFIRSGADYAADRSVAVSITAWEPEWQRLTDGTFPRDQIQLLVDCFYLPFRTGPRAGQLMNSVREVLRAAPDAIAGPLAEVTETARTLGRLFFDLGTLKNRDLFEALWPHVWRLKDELGLVVAIGEQRLKGNHPPFPAPDYPVGVFRGGLLGELRELVEATGKGYQPKR